MSFSRLLGTTAVLGLLGAPAVAATIYAQTFSTDPGWATDQPGNFYWDSTTQSFVARTYSGPYSATPNRYAFTPLNLDVAKSFVVSWSQRILDYVGVPTMHFGLTSDDLLFQGSTQVSRPVIAPTSTLNVQLSAFNYNSSLLSHQALDVYTENNGGFGQGYSSVSGGNQPGTVLGTWYDISLSYDAANNTITRSVIDTQTQAVLETQVSSVAGAFSPEMVNLAVGNNPIGYGSSIFDQDPNSYQTTEIDNIFVTGEYLVLPPPSLAFPLTGLDSIFTNVVAGGAAFDGVADDLHSAGKAYYAIDFDVNQDANSNGTADQASVLASAAGTIVSIGGAGKCLGEPVCVVIDHGGGYYSEYREFSTLDPNLRLGMTVAQGQILGLLIGNNTRSCGLAPCSTPDHLHFQVLYDVAGDGPGRGDSALSVTQLQGVTLGGLELTDYSLGSGSANYPGQGSVGFINSSGDVSQKLDGVLDQTTVSALNIGSSSTGRFIANGPIDVDVQNAITIGTGAQGDMFVVNGAAVTAQSVLVGPSGALNLSSGSITALNTGVTMAGLLTIGSSPGVGTIYGDFTMTGGLWSVEIGGASSGMYDVLNIFGNADFSGGTIGISFLNGFLPSVGDTFDFLKVSGTSNLNGTRFSVSGLSKNIGLSFLPSVSGGFSAVAVSNGPAPVPLPTGFPLLAAALAGMIATSTTKSRQAKRSCAGV